MEYDNVMVSVICAAYNHEPFIREALDGFVMQKTSFKYEVIINDDASTDNTASIIKEYSKKYPDIIKPIYQEENQYSQNNSVFDIMFSQAKGKYIATCEGDDYWIDANKLQKQFDFLESHPECSMYGHANIVVDQKSNYLYTRCECNTGYVNLINDGGYIHFATRMARREVYENIPKMLQKKYYGGVTYIYYAHFLGKIYYDDKAMSAWRINPNSVTHSLYLGNEKKKLIVYDYLSFFESFDAFTSLKFHCGLAKRSAEQLTDLISSCRKDLTKKEYADIKKNMGYKYMPFKYRLYVLVKSFL